MKDIIKAMEAFNENLVGGKRLVKALERDTPIGTMGIHLISMSTYIQIYTSVRALEESRVHSMSCAHTH